MNGSPFVLFNSGLSATMEKTESHLSRCCWLKTMGSRRGCAACIWEERNKEKFIGCVGIHLTLYKDILNCYAVGFEAKWAERPFQVLHAGRRRRQDKKRENPQLPAKTVYSWSYCTTSVTALGALWISLPCHPPLRSPMGNNPMDAMAPWTTWWSVFDSFPQQEDIIASDFGERGLSLPQNYWAPPPHPHRRRRSSQMVNVANWSVHAIYIYARKIKWFSSKTRTNLLLHIFRPFVQTQ